MENNDTLLRVLQKASLIELLLTDCDGVLTESTVYYSARGEELKKFSVRDGMGVARVRENGCDVGIVTGENSEPVKRRAEKLDIKELHCGIKDKLAVWDEILKRRSLKADQVAYIGDDVNDCDVLKRAGLAVCPADALPMIKEQVHYICRSNGGQGAFRELCELIVSGKNRNNNTHDFF